jgi:8-oxo-dGTP pyrophosphatase MutT (NUDIX family)
MTITRVWVVPTRLVRKDDGLSHQEFLTIVRGKGANNSGMIGFLGGKHDVPDQTIIEAACREVMEESTVRLESLVVRTHAAALEYDGNVWIVLDPKTSVRFNVEAKPTPEVESYAWMSFYDLKQCAAQGTAHKSVNKFIAK